MNKKETKKCEELCYASPDIEVVEIEFEQNILQAGSGDDFGDGGDF